MQTAIRCTMMRGGTSRGAYFLANDLPIHQADLAKVLAAVMGSPNPQQLNGIGGGTSVTSKVAIVSTSADSNADVDYLFAQVALDRTAADFSPSCGNILAGVAPFAIENGIVSAKPEKTVVRIRNVNTNTYIEAIVKTPHGRVTYEGDASIAGVVGTSAPIFLNFLNSAGSKTGMLLPTGHPVDTIQGIQVCCIDAAVPMVLIPAETLDKSGAETKAELDSDADFLKKLERIRREAGQRMGLGDVSDRVIPKVGLLSKPRHGGSITSRYFVPQTCHASHAVTGAICVATAALIEGTVVQKLATYTDISPLQFAIEHPSGVIEIRQEYARDNGQLDLKRSGVVRTARKLFSGDVYVPRSVWKYPDTGDLFNPKIA